MYSIQAKELTLLSVSVKDNYDSFTQHLEL